MKKQEKEEKKVRRGRYGFGSYAYNYFMFPIRRAVFFFIFKIIGLAIAFALAFLLLSGVVNQVKTGQTLVNYALEVGTEISEFFGSLLNNTSPFKFTKDGIYFKDAEVPDEGLFEDKTKDRVKEWKNKWSLPNVTEDIEGVGGNEE